MDRCKPIWIEHPLHRHVSGNLLALPEVIARREEPTHASEVLAAHATGVRNACATADREPPPSGMLQLSSSPDPETTDLGDERGRAADEGRYLLIAGADQLISVPLPASGAVVIGRDATADVALAHPKISRRHARVIVGAELAIEDLGSTNGVFVGGARVGLRTAWPIGESAKLGPFTAIVVRSRTGAPVTADGAAPASWWRSTARRCRLRCSRASCSGTRRARSPARRRASAAGSSWRTAAPSSSTRSAR